MSHVQQGLLILVTLSALALVGVRHMTRQQVVHLHTLQHQQQSMNDDWSRLQLEQATWGTPARVEELAAQTLKMSPPTPHETILVVP